MHTIVKKFATTKRKYSIFSVSEMPNCVIMSNAQQPNKHTPKIQEKKTQFQALSGSNHGYK